MTEQEARNRIVNVAAGLVGKAEADQSYMPILDAYNAIRPLPRGYRMKPEDPWCAAFVSAVGAMCGMSGAVLPECSCDAMIALYRAKGLYFSRRDVPTFMPSPGDLIFYNWDGDASADHVGIVERTIPGGWDIIEGNKSDTVGRRSVPIDWPLILGFVAPDYGRDAQNKPVPAETIADPAEKEAPVGNPTLRRGARGAAVAAMQGALIFLGYDCGPDGADGVFGTNTAAALLRVQSERGLTADEICGPATWAKLMEVTA